MNKHLDLERGCADNLFDLLSGALAGEHHPREAELFQPAGALGVVDRHLGGRIQPQPGAAAPQQGGGAQVLHDRRIHARLTGGAGDLHQHGELLLQQDDIQRQIDLQTPDMAVLDRFRKVLPCKICRIAAGVEHVNPEIDRVRTTGRRRAQALRTPGRGKYLDPAHAFGSLIWPLVSLPLSWRRRWAFSRLTSSSSIRALAASSRYSEICVRIRSAFSSLRL